MNWLTKANAALNRIPIAELRSYIEKKLEF